MKQQTFADMEYENRKRKTKRDATTLCKFRGLLHDNGITQMLFEATQKFLQRHERIMRGGTIVDASIIEAPTSTKNKSQAFTLCACANLYMLAGAGWHEACLM